MAVLIYCIIGGMFAGVSSVVQDSKIVVFLAFVFWPLVLILSIFKSSAGLLTSLQNFTIK